MIVKVQIPLKSLLKFPKAMVYNQDRTFDVFMEITDELLKVMGDEVKMFFHADYDGETHNTILGNVAPWQDW